MDKAQEISRKSALDPDEIDCIRIETYAPVALDGNVRQSFNMKDISVRYNKKHQYCTVVGVKQTVLIPVSNIAFMQI
jgi:hypothetical protein